MPLPGGTEYIFRRGEWTAISRPDHLRALLSPTPNGHVLRAEHELAPYFVTARSEAVQARCRYDWTVHTYDLKPGQYTQVDRVEYHLLTRQTDKVRGVTAAEVLGTMPDAHVLIQRDLGFGDLIILTAAVRALKRDFPRAHVSLACFQRFCGMMQRTGLYEATYDFFTVYDGAPFAIDADLRNWVERHRHNTSVMRHELFAEGLGVSCNGDYGMVCKPAGPSPVTDVDKPVAICLEGSVWNRNPSPAKCAEIVQAIAAAGFTPIGVMYPAPGWWPDVGLDFNGCGLEELLAIVGEAAVVSVDTGTLHAANAMRRPTVGLFGPIPSKIRVQNEPNCIALDPPAGCRWCHLSTPFCKRTTKCFDAISTDAIVEALRQVTA